MGITTYKISGGTLFDSDTAQAGVCIGFTSYASGASATLTYPALAGCTVVCTSAYGSEVSGATVDYALGYPRVTVASATYLREIVTWAFGAPSSIPTTGMYAQNSSGGMVLTPDGFGLNYIGKAYLHQTNPNIGTTGNRSMGSCTMRIVSATKPIAVIELTTTHYTVCSSAVNIGGNLWQIDATKCSITTNDSTGLNALATPDIWCFAQPTSVFGPPTVALYDSAGNIRWDLMASSLLAAYSNPNFSTGTTVTASVPSGPTTLGILGNSGGFQTINSPNGAFWTITDRRYMWCLDNLTTLRRQTVMTDQSQEDGAISFDGRGATSPIVIDLSNVSVNS